MWYVIGIVSSSPTYFHSENIRLIGVHNLTPLSVLELGLSVVHLSGCQNLQVCQSVFVIKSVRLCQIVSKTFSFISRSKVIHSRQRKEYEYGILIIYLISFKNLLLYPWFSRLEDLVALIPKLKLVRLQKRQGLVRTRMEGIR